MFENWPTSISPSEWDELRNGITMHKRNNAAQVHAGRATQQNPELEWESVDIENLRADGLQFLDNLLTSQQCDEMYEYFAEHYNMVNKTNMEYIKSKKTL